MDNEKARAPNMDWNKKQGTTERQAIKALAIKARKFDDQGFKLRATKGLTLKELCKKKGRGSKGINPFENPVLGFDFGLKMSQCSVISTQIRTLNCSLDFEEIK